MGNPFDSKTGLSLLDLDDLLTNGSGKFSPTPRRNNSLPKSRLSPFLIRLRPTTNDIFTGSHLLRQQRNRDPFFQSQLHTTKFELKPIPLPIPTLFHFTPLL